MPQRVQDTAESSEYSLATVLENLRSLDSGEMIQLGCSDDTASLYEELRGHVQRLSHLLSSRDAELAFSLVTLVSRLDRLAMISPKPDNIQQPTPIDAYSPADMYVTLSRQVSSFQLSQMGAQASTSSAKRPPIEQVEAALLWHSIDGDFENVLRLCHHPSEARANGDVESLPPGYEEGQHGDLPGYEYSEDAKVHGKEALSSVADNSSEKMKLELDSVVMAIERMYIVAPQLHNQRAEIRHRTSSEVGTGTQQVGKDSKMVDLILKSNNRRFVDQTYVLEGDMESRLAKAAQRDRQQREVFVEHIIERTSSGRLSSQDALPPIIVDRPRDPEEMISLPEFIREPMPQRRPTSSDGTHSADPSGSRVPRKSSVLSLSAKSEGLRQRSQSLSSLARLFPGHRSPSPRISGKMKAIEMDTEEGSALKRKPIIRLYFVV